LQGRIFSVNFLVPIDHHLQLRGKLESRRLRQGVRDFDLRLQVLMLIRIQAEGAMAAAASRIEARVPIFWGGENQIYITRRKTQISLIDHVGDDRHLSARYRLPLPIMVELEHRLLRDFQHVGF